MKIKTNVRGGALPVGAYPISLGGGCRDYV
jgi:hypothetical protein